VVPLIAVLRFTLELHPLVLKAELAKTALHFVFSHSVEYFRKIDVLLYENVVVLDLS